MKHPAVHSSLPPARLLTNGGLLEAATGGTLDVTIGMIANNGTAPLAASNPAGILVDGTFKVDNPTSSSADGSVTLGSSTGDPGGTLALAGGTIEGNSSNAETLKNADNTIEGYGSIGFGTDQLTLNNETNGTIDANVSGQTLTIDTGAAVTNSGLMEAADGATLSIRDILDNSSSGIVLASSGTVVLDGTSISGSGTYAITGGGTIDVQSAVSPNVRSSVPARWSWRTRPRTAAPSAALARATRSIFHRHDFGGFHSGDAHLISSVTTAARR